MFSRRSLLTMFGLAAVVPSKAIAAMANPEPELVCGGYAFAFEHDAANSTITMVQVVGPPPIQQSYDDKSHRMVAGMRDRTALTLSLVGYGLAVTVIMAIWKMLL